MLGMHLDCLYILWIKFKVLSPLIGVMDVSRMQIVQVWRPKCAFRLSLEQSLREGKDKSHNSVSEPQQSEFRWGSVSCQGIRLDWAPSFLVTGSHCSFGHLKRKLSPKEGSGVKLSVWLPTTKRNPIYLAIGDLPHIIRKLSTRATILF